VCALSKNESPALCKAAEIAGTNANPAETTPHVIMIRAIHRRAPTFSKMRFDGTSKMK
jgi:hypothetical protein